MMFAQSTDLPAIPGDTLKWVLAVLAFLLFVAVGIVALLTFFRKPAPQRLDDNPPIEIRKAPKRYNHELTEKRFDELERRVMEHTKELHDIQEDRARTLRHINARFERVLVGIANIAGKVGAKMPHQESEEQ